MRLPLILLAPLLLAGCFIQTASYPIDNDDHVITVRVEKPTFWSKEGTLRVILARLPDCQRQIELGAVWLDGLQVELFGNGNNVYTLRADDAAWQVETSNCSATELPDAAKITGLPLGIFSLDARNQLGFAKPEQAAQ